MAVPERPMSGRPLRGYRWKAEDKDFNAERIASLEAEVERLTQERDELAVELLDRPGTAKLRAEVERLRENYDRDLEWANKLLVERDEARDALKQIATFPLASSDPLPAHEMQHIAREALNA